MRNRKIRSFLIIITISLLVFVFGDFVREKVFGSQDDESLKLFTHVLRKIETSYVDEVETEKLVFDGISGMLSKLDPHSTFLDEEESKLLKEEQQGSFFGIGIQFNMIDDKITVITPIEGTPAYKAGMRAGDRIVKINGENAVGISQREVLKRLKGPKGTSVNIGVEREGINDLLDFTLIRDEIPSVSVPYSFMLNDDIGYLRITKFSQKTSVEVEEALVKLEDSSLKGLIIDLRGNIGGLLDQAVRISDMFIEGGKEIVSTRGRLKGSNKRFKSTNKHTYPIYPLVILVNYGSASGAEILAGAVQDHDRGLIIGTRTYGKGLVQNVYHLSMGCTVIITTQKYYTPSGRCIQKSYDEYTKIYRAPSEEEVKSEEDLSDKEIFYTDLKREVYGGGGIAPDVIFEGEKYGEVFRTIYMNELFTRFGLHYAAIHKDLPADFEVTRELFDDFQKYIDEKKVEVNVKDLGDDYEEAKLWLKRVILTSLWGSVKSAEFWMKNDPEVLKAIDLMAESKKLLARRTETITKNRKKK